MSRKTNVIKKSLAILLAVIIALPTACITANAAGESVSITAGELVANNYDCLSDEEKAVLASGFVTGGSYTYTEPDASDNLVSVDSTNKTVTAAVIIKDGHTWTPVSAKVVYSGGNENVNLTQPGNDYTGTFTYSGSAYKVDVTYAMAINADADLQSKLLNGPYYLAKGLDNLDSLYLLDELDTIADEKNALNSLKYMISSNDTKNAIDALIDQVNTYGQLELKYMLNEYFNTTMAETIPYLYDHGAEIKDKATETYNYINTICSDTEIDGKVNSTGGAAGYRMSLAWGAIQDLRDAMADILADGWDILDASKDPLKANLTAAEYGDLYDLVLDIDVDNTAAHTDAPKALNVPDVVISKNVNQYNVTIKVEANVVPNAPNDCNTLVALETYTTVYQFAQNTDGTVVYEKAEECKTAALAVWGIDASKYQITVNGTVPATIQDDVTYTVTYNPIEYTLKITDDETHTSAEEQLPYGYRKTLPTNANTNLVYDYYVGTTRYLQGDVITITGNVNMTRKEGKPWSVYTKDQIVAEVYANVLTPTEKDILNSAALNSDNVLVRVPTNEDGLVTVSLNNTNGKYEVTAQSYSSDVGSLMWRPVSGSVIKDSNVIRSFGISAGQGEFPIVDFDSVTIKYELDITSSALIDNHNDVVPALNTPKALADDAAAQKVDMNVLNDNTLYNRLGELDKKTLNLIQIGIKGSNMNQEAVNTIINKCVNSETSSLYLYDYLTEYRKNGLTFYYQDGNYEKIRYQVSILYENLNEIFNDSEFDDLLDSLDYSSYYGKIADIIDKLRSVNNDLYPDHLTAPNGAIITSSPSLSSLVDSINALTNTRSFSDADATRYIVLKTNLTAAAPGKSVITVTVQQKNSAGNVIKSDSVAVIVADDDPIGGSVQNAADGLITALGIDTDYYNTTDTLPATTAVYTADATVTVTYTPNEYTANIKESGNTVDSQTFPFDNAKVTLAGAPSGILYRYTVGTEEIVVGTEAKVYTFTTQQIDSGVYATITRKTVDPYRDAVLSLIDELNRGTINAGLTDNHKSTLAFIPLEDATGKISIVLRVSPINMDRDNLQDALVAIAEALLASDFKYIRLNNEFLREDSKVSVQTIINTALNSSVSLDTILNAIDENGDINEWTLAGVTPINAEIDSENHINIYYGNDRVNDADVFGAKMMQTTIAFGKTKNAMNPNIDVYVTLEDFDLKADDLKDLRKMAKKVRDYGNVTAHNGMLDIEVTLPDRVYQAYLTAMLALGNTDLGDIGDIDLDNFVDLAFDIMRFIAGDETITTTTYENTADKLDKDLDLSDYSSYYSKARKALKYVLDKFVFENETTTENSYSADVDYDIDDLFDYANIDDTLQSLIKEKDDKLYGKVKLTINNTADYEAIIIDPDANGTGKLVYTRDLAGSLATIHNDSIVILLKGYNGNLTVNKRITLDLNGKLITGDLICNAKTLVVDSKLATDSGAGVTGNVTGNAVITAGGYSTDVSSKLKGGYVVGSNNVVRNGYYYVVVENDEIKLHLTPDVDVAEASDESTMETLATELVADIARNYYLYAAIKIGGNEIYNFTVDDIMKLTGTIDAVTMNEIVDCINCNDITVLANDLLDKLLNLDAVGDSIANNTAVATYSFTGNPWTFDLTHVANGDYLSADIKPDTTRTDNKTISIFIDENDGLSDLFKALGEIMTIDADVSLDDLEYDYAHDDLKATASGMIDVIIDLTDDNVTDYPNFAIATGVVLANGLTGTKRDALIDAINEFYASGSVADLKAAIDDVTTKELLDNLGSKTAFDTMLSNLGLSAVVTTEVKELYAKYRNAVVNIIGIINNLNIDNWNGSDRTIGYYETEYGKYEDSETNATSETNREVFDTYGVAAEATLTSAKLTLKMFKPIIKVTDANTVVTYEGDDLTAAFAAATDDSTIEVLENVTLAQAAELDCTATLIGAEKITFEGDNKISITDATAQLTSDKMITDYVISGVVSYDVKEEQSGTDYVYSLEQVDVKIGLSLELQDAIQINCRVYELALDPTECTLKYKFEDEDDASWIVKQLDQTNTYDLAHLNDVEKVVVARCAAKEMNRIVQIKVCHNDNTIKEMTYSVRQYCEEMIAAKETSTEEKDIYLVDLCRYTLDYGAKAQVHFDYEKDNPVNGGNYHNGGEYINPITNEAVNIINDCSTYRVIAKGGTGEVKLGVAASLEYRTEINIYNYSTVSNYVAVYVHNEEDNEDHPYEYTIDTINGTRLTIAGIAAKDLDKAFTVHFDNGTTFTCSVLSYAYDRIKNNRADKDVCKALFNYYLAASKYLG